MTTVVLAWDDEDGDELVVRSDGWEGAERRRGD